MTISVFDMATTQHLWSTPEMRDVFSEENKLRTWAQFEAALAQCQAILGILPERVAKEISSTAKLCHFDVEQIAAEGRRIKHTLMPFLRQFQQQLSPEAAEWLHFGATTQDVVDTGLMLQLKQAHRLIKSRLATLGCELVQLCAEHRDTVMTGRTHGVHALPITFGHKCAIWLDEISRHAERLTQAEPRLLVAMVCGAVGSQAGFGPEAYRLQQTLSDRLELSCCDISWAPARDRLAEYANLLALLGATLGKIGHELFTLQRTEIGEIEEAFFDGKMGSSTMPHKRNPAAAENLVMLSRCIRSSANLMMDAMGHEQERDAMAWKCEWKAIPETILMCDAALFQTQQLLQGLKINKHAMRRNLDMMQGYLLSERIMLELAKRTGKKTAHQWIYEASMAGLEAGVPFEQALSEHEGVAACLDFEHIADALKPECYLGTIGEQIDRVLAREEGAAWLCFNRNSEVTDQPEDQPVTEVAA